MNIKWYVIIFLTILFSGYMFMSSINPVNDDEANYILTGEAIVRGEIYPFSDHQERSNHHSPFKYIMGSPIAPTIFGGVFILFGMIGTRILAAILVVISLYILFLIIKDKTSNIGIALVLILAGAAYSFMMLSTKALLDTLALPLLAGALFFFDKKKYLWAGLLMALATATKFILLLPLICLLLYLIFTKKFKQASYFSIFPLFFGLIGLILYFTFLSALSIFIFSKTNVSLQAAGSFLKEIWYSVPVLTLLGLLSIRKKNMWVAFAFLPLLVFEIVTLDFNAWGRHLAYIELMGAIMFASFAHNIKKNKYILAASIIIILWIIYMSVYFAVSDAKSYPSYELLKEDFPDIEGKILAINSHSFLMVYEREAYYISNNINTFHYLEYDDNPQSNINDYKAALDDNFFDYVIISPPENNFEYYNLIQDAVKEKYCHLKTNHEASLAVYAPCP